MNMFWDWGWLVAALSGIYAVYATVVKPKLDEAAQVLDKAYTLIGLEGWHWLWGKVSGWKTIILSVISGGMQLIQLIPAETLTDMQQFPWGSMFEPIVANRISLVCAILIPVTHAYGVLNAAKTPPVISDWLNSAKTPPRDF